MVYWTVICLIVLPFALMLGNVLFGSWHEFGKAILYAVIPWYLAAAMGSWEEYRWMYAKTMVFVLTTGTMIVLVHMKFGAAISAWLQ